MSVSALSPASVDEIHQLIRTELKPHFGNLAQHASTADLEADSLYQKLRPAAQRVLEQGESGDFRNSEAPAKAQYRVAAWNLERGIEYDGQLDIFQQHPYLSKADVLCLTETDVGMARSANRNVARELARALGMSYSFVPCYINLAKGAGVERDASGQNDLGLHGNAILSRYPIANHRSVALKNGKDKMKGREKRLGRQAAILADVEFPNHRTEVVSVHLDAHSSQGHRRDQMRDVLDALRPDGPAIVGGDWNTTTYNSSSAANAILGFWVRVFMGVDNVIDNHYLHPYNKFERALFGLLEERGFDFRACNVLGERTTSYDSADLKTHKNLREWVPAWCFAFIRWALRNHDGKCPLKIDWFATRSTRVKEPRVIHEVREGRQPPLSDHDAIGMEIVVGG